MIISCHVMHIMIKYTTSIPFHAVSSADSWRWAGSRVVLHEGSSAHSGSYVVEECDSSEGGEGVRLRRLIFLTSQHLAQTEVHMVPGTCMSPSWHNNI